MNEQSRQLYFWLGCMPARTLFVLLAYFLPVNYLPYFGMLTLLISIGFIRSYFFSKKKVGFFKGDIWWNDLRLIHSIIYLLFSISAFSRSKCSWIFLLVDLFIGLISFITHYYLQSMRDSNPRLSRHKHNTLTS